MKTTRGIFPRLVSLDHLHRALRRTARNKRRRADIAWAVFNADALVKRLRAELLAGRWTPLGFDLLMIRDPKPRVVARAPVEDRLVHMAVTSLLEEVFLPSVLPEDMACRAGAGVHRARLTLQRHVRRRCFAVHLDVRAYFPSVNLGILRTLVARRVRDDALLQVLGAILASGSGLHDQEALRRWLGLGPDWPPAGRGLPVGAYTSQFLATHVYLAGLDHFIKRVLKAPGYCRYGDDIFLFGERREGLRAWRQAVGPWLVEERHLRLKHPEARVLASAGHLDALGARIDREEIRASREALRRFEHRVRAELRRPPHRERRAHLERSNAASFGLLLG